MNLFKSILIVMFSTLLFVSCEKKENTEETESTAKLEKIKPKKEIAKANLQNASFTIKGMTCAVGCAKTIEEELNGLDGVKTATVDFEKESATVAFDKTVLTTDKLAQIVEATADGKSYKVSDIKL
jgi:mercuric ion binding protein